MTLISVLFAGSAAACTHSRMSGPTYEKEGLVDNTRNILLVRVENREHAKHGSIMQHFEVLKVIKGNDETLRPKSLTKTAPNRHFSDHREDEFWNEDIGRIQHPSERKQRRRKNIFNCNYNGPYYPTFEEGKTYLLFVGEEDSAKAAELIRKPDDKWLVYVSLRVAGMRMLCMADAASRSPERQAKAIQSCGS